MGFIAYSAKSKTSISSERVGGLVESAFSISAKSASKDCVAIKPTQSQVKKSNQKALVS